MNTLLDYCKMHGIKYRAAWNRYKLGKIPGAFQDEFGKILIPEVSGREPYVVCYARVSSSQNKANLETQADRLVAFANAAGYVVRDVVKEVGSGLNDNRRKLNAVLNNPIITHVIVEHKDRLTRFGFCYLKMLLEHRGCKIIVINEAATDREDLMQDFVSLVTSFTARLYGLRRTRRQTEKIINEISNDSQSTAITKRN